MTDEETSKKIVKFRNLLQDFMEYLHQENLFERFSKDRKEADMINMRKGFASSIDVSKSQTKAKDQERVKYVKSVFLSWFKNIYLNKFYGPTTTKYTSVDNQGKLCKSDIACDVLVNYEGGDFLKMAPRIERSRMDNRFKSEGTPGISPTLSFTGSPTKSQNNGIGIFDSILRNNSETREEKSEELHLSRAHESTSIRRPLSSGHAHTPLKEESQISLEQRPLSGQESNPGLRSDGENSGDHSPIQVVADLKAIKTTEKGEFQCHWSQESSEKKES